MWKLRDKLTLLVLGYHVNVIYFCKILLSSTNGQSADLWNFQILNLRLFEPTTWWNIVKQRYADTLLQLFGRNLCVVGRMSGTIIPGVRLRKNGQTIVLERIICQRQSFIQHRVNYRTIKPVHDVKTHNKLAFFFYRNTNPLS